MPQTGIQFKAHNCDSSESLEQYALKRFQKVQRHFNSIIDVKFTFKVVNNHEHCASAVAHVPMRTLCVDEVSQNMYEAIDKMVDKLDKMVRQHKDKLRSH